MTAWMLEVTLASMRMIAWTALALLGASLARQHPGRLARAGLGLLAIGALLFALRLLFLGSLLFVASATVALAWRGRGGTSLAARLGLAWVRAVRALRQLLRALATLRRASACRRGVLGVVRLLARFSGPRPAGPVVLALRRRRRARRLALAAALVPALAVVLLRARSDAPLAPGDADAILRREGWLDFSSGWVPDLVALQLLERLAGAPPAAGALAAGAPIVLIAGASGAALLPRFCPGAPAWLGAAGTALPPAAALVSGHPVSLALLLPALLPWVIASGSSSSWRTVRPAWVAVGLAPLHPSAALLGVGALGAELAARRPFCGAASWRHAFAVALLAALALAVGLLCAWNLPAPHSAWLEPHPSAAGSPPLSGSARRLLVLLAVGASGWLILGRTRGLGRRAVAARRALGLLTVGVAGAAWKLGETPFSVFSPELTAGLAVLAVSVGAADLAARSGGAAASVLALSVGCVALLPAWAGAGVRRAALELSASLRAEHLPWTYTVVGSPELIPSFAGTAFFTKGEVAAQLLTDGGGLASETPGSPLGARRPEDLQEEPAESSVFVVLEAESAPELWVDALRRAGATLRPRPHGARSDLGLYRLELPRRAPEERDAPARAGISEFPFPAAPLRLGAAKP